MNNVVQDKLSRFWTKVREFETEIRRQGRGTIASPWIVAPDAFEKYDEDFYQRYQDISPHLQRFAKPKLIAVPSGVPGMVPFLANTFHEAVMFFLDPVDCLRAAVDGLKSDEYRRIKEAAYAELGVLNLKTRQIVSPTRATAEKPRNVRKTAVRDRVAKVRDKMLEHVRENTTPLTQAGLAKLAKVSQRFISQHFKEIVPGGWKYYLKAFRTGELRRGIIDRCRGDGHVDGIEDDRDLND